MAIEKTFSTGDGATTYLLSRCDGNNPYPLSISDSEGCECDGSTSNFEPQSVCCSVPF